MTDETKHLADTANPRTEIGGERSGACGDAGRLRVAVGGLGVLLGGGNGRDGFSASAINNFLTYGLPDLKSPNSKKILLQSKKFVFLYTMMTCRLSPSHRPHTPKISLDHIPKTPGFYKLGGLVKVWCQVVYCHCIRLSKIFSPHISWPTLKC